MQGTLSGVIGAYALKGANTDITSLSSVSLLGTPTAPTAAVDTNTTQVASTAFVLGQAASATPIVDGSAAVGTSTRFARADHVHPSDTSRAGLVSPTFSGTPTTPTATYGTNTLQIASTAFVQGAVSIFAQKGTNSDITGLTGLTSPIPVSGGGTGSTNAIGALGNLGAAPQASPTFTGVAYSPQFFAGVSGTGSTRLTGGDATHTGYVDFLNASGTRLGFIGYGTSGTLILAADSGNHWNLDGGTTISGNPVASTVSPTFTGNATFTGGTTLNGPIVRSGAAGTNREVALQTSGASRWYVYADATAETGSNTGSNFAIARFNDAGSYVDNSIYISRVTGQVSVSGALAVNGNTTITGIGGVNGELRLNPTGVTSGIGATIVATSGTGSNNADLSIYSGALYVNSPMNVTGGVAITGDIHVNRAGASSNTGAIFLNASANRYIYYTGTVYEMPSADLYVNSGRVMTYSNISSGAGFGGNTTAPSFTAVTGSDGYARLDGGNSTAPGLVRFYLPNGTATGYAGYANGGGNPTLTGQNGYNWDLAAGTTISNGAIASQSYVNTAIAAVSGTTSPGIPQGRITLTSGTPVMTSTVSAATTVYFTPMIGSTVPLWNGSTFVSTAFTELSRTTSGLSSASVYDLFIWSNSGTVTASFGPAWAAGTSGSNTARGTGSGSTSLTRSAGVLVNQYAISGGPGAGYGTYVGTVLTDAGAAAITWNEGTSASGGGAAWLGVWNYYNRVSVSALVQDSTTSWTVSNTSLFPCNGSNGNRATMVIGYAEDTYKATFTGLAAVPSSSAYIIEIGLDSNSTRATKAIQGYSSAVSPSNTVLATWTGRPGIGSHYIHALEARSGSSNSTSYGGIYQGLSVEGRF